MIVPKKTIQDNKNIFLITAYRRPDSLKTCLESVKKINNIEAWNVLISLDGGYDKKNIDIILDKNIYPYNNIYFIQHEKNLGVTMHYIVAMDYAYNLSDRVLATEEDCIFTRDICDLTDNFYNSGLDKEYTTLFFRHFTYTEYLPGDEGKFSSPKVDYPSVFFTIPKDFYISTREKYLNLPSNLCKDYRNIEIFKDTKMLMSHLPRGKHIYCGEHVTQQMQTDIYDKQWFDETTYHPYFDKISIVENNNKV